MTCFPHCLFFSVLLIFISTAICRKIACKNERSKNVDRYINYKLPAIDREPVGSKLRDGKAYAYMTSSSTSSWILSTKSVTSGSMMENTMNNFYSNKEVLTYLFYNDDPPESYNGTAVGHLKGVLAFDEDTGFWLIHSIPKFANDKVFEYPDNALINGQTILCVTFSTSELNEISKQLLYDHPNIYARHITEEVRAQLDSTAQSLFTDNPSFIRRDPLTSTTSIKSFGNKPFTSFAKDNQFKEDLFSEIIAPQLQSSLLAETWRRGSGTFLPPSCESPYTVIDIVSINMTVGSGRNSKNIFFKSTEDHSKWAISADGERNWICIADLNRMESQGKRGGGALCFISAPVRNAYRSIISETDQCPT